MHNKTQWDKVTCLTFSVMETVNYNGDTQTKGICKFVLLKKKKTQYEKGLSNVFKIVTMKTDIPAVYGS
jgi:hypothetical protein